MKLLTISTLSFVSEHPVLVQATDAVVNHVTNVIMIDRAANHRTLIEA